MKNITILLFLILSVSSVRAQSKYTKQAVAYAEAGDYNKAIELETKGLKLIENSKGKHNIEYVFALFNLGLYYTEIDDNKKVKEIAIEIENTPLDLRDDDNYDYIEMLDELADYYLISFDYDHAISLDALQR